MVRTQGFQPCNRGSIPLPATAFDEIMTRRVDMKKFFAGLLIYGVGLFSIGAALLPDAAYAGHWVYCSYATKAYPYPHIAHSPKRCYAPGYWIWVSW